jgi:hypothetical protein
VRRERAVRLDGRAHPGAELVHDGGDVVCAEMVDLLWALRDGAVVVEGSLPFGLGFDDPAGHKDGVGAGVEGGSGSVRSWRRTG